MYNKGDNICGYKVTFPIKKGLYAETYRVKDKNGRNLFLKLFAFAKLQKEQYDQDHNVTEVELLKNLSHPNLVKYIDSGEFVDKGQRFLYLVTEFVAGETLAQKLAREQMCSVYEAKRIIFDVLEGVKYLHNQDVPVIHNELTTQNIMLFSSGEEQKAVIIDFGHAKALNQSRNSFVKGDLDPFYLAPESFNGVFSVQSDIYSIGALLYHILFGLPPFFLDLSRFHSTDEKETAVLQEKKRPLRILDKDKFELDEQIINILSRALAEDVDDRFQSVEQFISALKGEMVVSAVSKGKPAETDAAEKSKTKKIKKGNGFADVVGMDELKEKLRFDVIDLLQHPEEAQKWGISIPNGILFYGPPGCGKTFFAEKFAEEAGLNFIKISCSDVASPYIHGGQDKIAAVFEEARKNAPTILFLDEVEVMISDRGSHNNSSMAGEVNEFLVQLNNCGESGVLVIGATNYPTVIDKAALRAGRLELKYYIPQPDKTVRKAFLELYLKRTRRDLGIDYDGLAEKTENYSSSQIKLLVDEAIRLSRRKHADCVTNDTLLDIISKTTPELSPEDIARHEAIRDEFERKKKPERRKIGF